VRRHVRGVVGLLLLVLSSGTGCERIPEAPTELNELSAYLFRNFEHEQEETRSTGMANLQAFFADVDLTQPYQDLAYAVDDLTEEDVADVVHPDRDPALTLPVGLVTGSAFPPDDHATIIILEDQTPVEPNSPTTYDRAFVDPTDPSCFPDRGCLVLRAENHIWRENAVVDLWHDTHKDFRWVELGEEGSGEWGILARSWLEETVVGEVGNVTLHQNFSIDVFLPDGDGAIRYMALWSETEIEGIPDETMEFTAKLGIHQMFDATEAYLEDQAR